MTGFGRAILTRGTSTLVAEVSAVNQRGLAISLHLPSQWTSLEPEISAAIRTKLQRGKVTLKLVLEQPSSIPNVAEPLAQLRRLAHAHSIPGEPNWEVLLRLSERQTQASPTLDDVMRADALSCCHKALDELDVMRAREGESLRADLSARLGILSDLVDTMERSAASGPARQRDRLLHRLSELGLSLDPSDERVARELVIHADRSDISEEITRLRSHLAQGRALLDGIAPGRTLDFLSQEFLREANTVGSKASEIATTQAVLAAKVEIERIREQVQNVE